MKTLMLVASISLTLIAQSDAASPPSPAPVATPQQIAAQAAERARQASLPDTRGTGAFPALKEEVPSLPKHVVYRPAKLDALKGTKLGVYIFGNGACSDDAASSRLHLLEVASHGYLAIAPGRIRTGPGATAPMPEGTTLRNSAPELTRALDWAIAQNADPRSPYHGLIDTKAAAVSGYSCGGAQAMKVAADPRWKTVVMMNSGLLNVQPAVSLADMDAGKDLLAKVHTPLLYVLGGETDVAWVNAMDDFKRIDTVPVFIADLKGVGHGGTYWEPNGGAAARVVVAWLDWQLRGDAKAARMFTGKDCGLCRDSAWVVHRKKIE